MKHIKSTEYIDDNVCRVVLDDYTVLELDSFSVSQSGIEAGEDAEDAVIAELIFTSECIKAQKIALKYLNLKMRTEKQLEKYLKGKGFSPEAIQNTLENMKQWGYIDDAAYARAYIDYRLSCSKKSWRAIFYDLKAEGINEDTIEEVTGEYDADEYLRARDVAARVLNGKSDEASLRRLNGLLARNGFGWDVVNQVVSEASRGEEF